MGSDKKVLNMRRIQPLLLTLLALIPPAFFVDPPNKVILCYFESWATYRWGEGFKTKDTVISKTTVAGTFDVEDIDPFICTHMVYTFAGLSNETLTITPLDPYNDLYDNWGKGAYDRFIPI